MQLYNHLFFYVKVVCQFSFEFYAVSLSHI